MLESILNPKKARKSMSKIFLLSVMFTAISTLFSYFIFPEYSSVLLCAYITILFAPFFQRLFASEEAKEEFALKYHANKNLFQRHAPVIKIYSSFFLGVILMLSLFAVFLPNGMKEVLFEKQISEVKRLSGMVTASAINTAEVIFFNNIAVMLLAFFSSFLFGTGALFILSWNASVIAVYVGSYVKLLIGRGMVSGLAYIFGMPSALLAITLHGIPEIIGYFFAGLAGGILSCGIIKEKINSKELGIIFFDSLIFLGFATFSIFVGAFIEVSPVLYSAIGFVSYLAFMIMLLYYGKK